ncbi:uncharacterized protein LOC105929986 [Fundulus heteroclitus]|uniref:uncharacterized protein LOC105929986 n=1 Tax=Fundulus heteroclitus TaxID=8078 RepID=UPI00165B4FA7|nr:uncharacterized protein LOC105929986 [Fundulus heteroclitus]
MASFQLLLFLGYFAAARAGVVLNCTNDYEKISCQLSAKQCSKYAVNIRNDQGYGEYNCSLKRCNSELCCCSVKIFPVAGETYTVETFNGSQKVDTKTLDLWESFKPKTPTIVSVKEYEGIFTVNWKTNMGPYFVGTLTAEVTVSKKGEQGKVYGNIRPATVEGLQSFDINGQDLEPGTAYVVSVRSYTDWSQMFSDRSQECEFKTPPSKSYWILGIIIAISAFGIILFVSVYSCVVRVKRKWWDSYSEPKKLVVPTRTPEILNPKQIATSFVQVKEPLPSHEDQMLKILKQMRADAIMGQNSSGINTGSSVPCYGQTEPPDIKAITEKAVCEALKAFFPNPILGPGPQHDFPPVHRDHHGSSLIANETSSGSSGIVNPSYFRSAPSSPIETTEHNPTFNQQDNLPLSCKSNTVNCTNQDVSAFLLSAQKAVSPAMQVDMSYQPCKVQPKRSSYAETASLSSTSSGNITSASCGLESKLGAGFDRSGEWSADSVKAMLTLSSWAPSGSDRCAVIIDDYNPCPSKVVEPDVPISEKQSRDHHQRVNVNQDESVNKIPQHCRIPGFNNWTGQCPSVIQIPSFPTMSTEMSFPVVIDNDYKCV